MGSILVTAAAGVWSSHARVIDNVCDGGGITFTGTDGLVAHNRVTGSGRAVAFSYRVLPALTLRPLPATSVAMAVRVMMMRKEGRWWSVNGFEIWAPDSLIYNNVAHDNDGGGFAIGGQNSISR